MNACTTAFSPATGIPMIHGCLFFRLFQSSYEVPHTLQICFLHRAETATADVPQKVFHKNSQENTRARAPFLIKLQA